MVVEEEKEKMSEERWIVTYTKHMKQKRKVYHDGVLEFCGSSGKPQVVLYDDCEKVIDRRFLKKDEIVKSGGTLSFETHIVDIGDPDGNKKPSAESNVKSVIQPKTQKEKAKSNVKLVMQPETQKEKAKSNVKSVMQPETQKEKAKSNVKSVTQPEIQKEKLCEEWNVLYTTQMTQKAKKYHDGVLRVVICSSHLNQITLLNEDGAILSSKYLKSVECLETGKNFEFPNYLVEICERRASAAGLAPNRKTYGWRTSNARAAADPNNHPKDHSMKVTSNCNSQIGGKNSNTTILRDDHPKDHSMKVTSDCNSQIGGNNSKTTMLRDAWQILSVLKKPSLKGNLVLCDPFVEQGLVSQPSDKCEHDLQKSSENIGPSACDGLKSRNSQDDSISAAHLVLDADCEGISSEKELASSILSSGAVALDTSTKFIVNNTGGHAELTTKALEVLIDPTLSGSNQTGEPDNPISDIGCSREVILNKKPVVPSQNSLGAFNGKHHLSASTSIFLKVNLNADERSSFHGMDTGLSSDSSTPAQFCAGASETGEGYEAVPFAIGASTVHATSDATKDHLIPSAVDDFPTFDLGL